MRAGAGNAKGWVEVRASFLASGRRKRETDTIIFKFRHHAHRGNRWRTTARVPAQVHQLGSMCTVFFTDRPVTDFASAQASDARRFAAFANALRDAGVLVPPSPCETWFLSTAHSAQDADHIIRAIPDAFATAGS